jgi:hypothetical protein
VGTIFTGKALALDISALTMGKVTAIGVTATEVIRTDGMATGVIRAGVIRTEVMAMGIPMGATPTVVMAMEVILTGTRLARATRNYRIERILARHDLAGLALASSFGRHPQQDRPEVTMPLSGRGLSDCLPATCTRQGSNLQPYDPTRSPGRAMNGRPNWAAAVALHCQIHPRRESMTGAKLETN